mmetsp:Transcript_21124/g.65064  ORF Transcript_21124/g.65064 Transcript_21124/m.65064 type:complete len:200 (-) Transcript_21124:700-1299(-)
MWIAYEGRRRRCIDYNLAFRRRRRRRRRRRGGHRRDGRRRARETRTRFHKVLGSNDPDSGFFFFFLTRRPPSAVHRAVRSPAAEARARVQAVVAPQRVPDGALAPDRRERQHRVELRRRERAVRRGVAPVHVASRYVDKPGRPLGPGQPSRRLAARRVREDRFAPAEHGQRDVRRPREVAPEKPVREPVLEAASRGVEL